MGSENSKKLKCCRENIWRKIKSIARTVSIEAVLQLRFHYAMNYFSFDAEVLFAFFVFGDTFFMLGLMVHIGLGSAGKIARILAKLGKTHYKMLTKK